jgi:hypothetical protein
MHHVYLILQPWLSVEVRPSPSIMAAFRTHLWRLRYADEPSIYVGGLPLAVAVTSGYRNGVTQLVPNRGNEGPSQSSPAGGPNIDRAWVKSDG